MSVHPRVDLLQPLDAVPRLAGAGQLMVFALEETDPALNALMDELGIVGDVAES